MKIGLISLGCPKNLVDSEVMLGLARQAGHELTQDAADADVLVVNTCAFINSAKQESIDAILEMAQHKKDGACRRLIVTGCMAERYRDELKREIPEIDAVLGTGQVPEIVDAIGAGRSEDRPQQNRDGAHPDSGTERSSARATAGAAGSPQDTGRGRPSARATAGAAGSQQDTGRGRPSARATAGAAGSPQDTGRGRSSDRPTSAPMTFFRHGEPRTPSPQPLVPNLLPTYIYDAETPRLLATPRHYAYVKIAEGCDYKCAFCIIPTLRGKYRSRPADSIVREARALAAGGVKELLLISQDTTFYGIDRHERGALARLLRELNAVDGLEWIRLLYLYPTTIDDDTLAAMAECDKICKYIDLPLQHASDAVLKRMKRPGTRQAYDRLLSRIRERVPGVALRTTLIVGFPGETEADVDEMDGFLRDHAFDHVGVFTYSHEEGTSAFQLDDDVPARTKTARRARMMGLQKRLVRRRQRDRIGQRVRVLVDGPSPDHDLVLKARLSSQAPDIDASVYLTDCDPSTLRPGDFAEVEIVGAREYDLIARPVL